MVRVPDGKHCLYCDTVCRDHIDGHRFCPNCGQNYSIPPVEPQQDPDKCDECGWTSGGDTQRTGCDLNKCPHKQDPVVDINLSGAPERFDLIDGQPHQMINGKYEPCDLEFVIKESRSTAIADYYNKLKEWCDEIPGEMFGSGSPRGEEEFAFNLLKYAEELKDKIANGK